MHGGEGIWEPPLTCGRQSQALSEIPKKGASCDGLTTRGGGLSRAPNHHGQSPIWQAMAQKATTLLGGISLLAHPAVLKNRKRAATKPSAAMRGATIPYQAMLSLFASAS